METNKIYDYLEELTRCDYQELEATQDLSCFRYNGVAYCEGSVPYQKRLESGYKGFKSAILDLFVREQSGGALNVILADYREAFDQYRDIPDDDCLVELQTEYDKHGVPETLKTIREVKFIREMSSLQMWYLREAMRYISKLIGDMETKQTRPLPESVTELEDSEVKNRRIISGVQGLADHLGCSKSKAMEIVRSRILVKDKIQYKVGENWKFNREKLDEYLANNPEALGRKRGG